MVKRVLLRRRLKQVHFCGLVVLLCCLAVSVNAGTLVAEEVGQAATDALAEKYCQKQPHRCEEIKQALEKIRKSCVENPIACKLYMERKKAEAKKRREEVLEKLKEKMSTATSSVLAEKKKRNVSMRLAAYAVGVSRVVNAMKKESSKSI